MKPRAALLASGADTVPPKGSDMAVTEQPTAIDEDKLGAFMNQAVGELGATLGAALVVIGDKLGLYKALAGTGPSPPRSSPSAPAPRSATCASGSTPRRRAAT